MKLTEELIQLKKKYEAIVKEGLLTLKFPKGFPETESLTNELKQEKDKIYSDYRNICLADIPLTVAFESQGGDLARIYLRGSNKAESSTLTRLSMNFLNNGSIEDEILKPTDVTPIGRSFYVDTMSAGSTAVQVGSTQTRVYESVVMNLITNIKKSGFQINIVKLRDFDVGGAK